MNAFESAAVLEDASHLTLRDPVPGAPSRECRVLVLFDSNGGAMAGWPAGFFEDIRITDPAFVRPAQGGVPPVAAWDA